MRRSIFLHLISTGLLFTSLHAVAQVPAVAPAAQSAPVYSIYQDPIFYILAFVALVLLIFILQLARVLGAVATQYKKGDGSKWDSAKSIALLIGSTVMFSVTAGAQTAQEAAPVEDASAMLKFYHEGFGHPVFNILALTIVIELLVVLYYTRMIKLFITKPAEAPPLVAKKTSSFWDKFNRSVSVEKEAAVLTDHDYDGIRELDNALPPWWKYGFYLTIVWGLIYLVYYHVSKAGPLMIEEYQIELAEGQRLEDEYKARAQNLVDESNVTVLTDATAVAEGGKIFGQYCAVCHGPDGGGLVGPNLTDAYWLHGGDIKNLFTVVKYGVQGKGMKSWQQELSPAMMAQVTSYILTLQGTTPANPKTAEGNLYKPADPTLEVAVQDTTPTVSDTTVTAAVN